MEHGVPELYAYKLDEVQEAESLLSGDVPAAVTELKQGDGGPILVAERGGVRLSGAAQA